MKKKINLKSLTVKSFITYSKDVNPKTVKGGRSRFCESEALLCPSDHGNCGSGSGSGSGSDIPTENDPMNCDTIFGPTCHA